MCLVGLAWMAHPRWRLVVAGNRDEWHDRPTAALARWNDGSTLAGRDLRSGGTWMGLGPHGRMAVVTNVRDGPPAAFDGPSRGALPADFLAGSAAAEASAEAIASGADHYAPFNLVLADANACVHVGNHPALGVRPIPPGVHALSNGPFDAPWPKVRRLQARLETWADCGSQALEPLWAALADEQLAADEDLPRTGIPFDMERRLSSSFVRGELYGTRASTLVLVDPAGQSTIIERRYGPGGDFLGETTLESGGNAPTIAATSCAGR